MCGESCMHGVEWGKIRRLLQRITYHYRTPRPWVGSITHRTQQTRPAVPPTGFWNWTTSSAVTFRRSLSLATPGSSGSISPRLLRRSRWPPLPVSPPAVSARASSKAMPGSVWRAASSYCAALFSPALQLPHRF